jgi:hypothetical protein
MHGTLRLEIRIRPGRVGYPAFCAAPAKYGLHSGPDLAFAGSGFVLPAVFRIFAAEKSTL